MKTKKELANNPWFAADKYADAKYHVEKGDDISKYEKYIEVKTAFEAGYKEAREDYADKTYSEEEMLFAFVHGGTKYKENLDAEKLRENFKELINALNKPPFNQEEWSAKIRKASAEIDGQNPEKFHPAFNHAGTGEITIPGDPEIYRVPIEMWYDYHEALYNTKMDRHE